MNYSLSIYFILIYYHNIFMLIKKYGIVFIAQKISY